MQLKERLGAILRAHKIVEIEYSLSGGGDSGEATLECVTFQDGAVSEELPDVPVQFADNGAVGYLPELLENIVADAPDGDWVNNEGGHGTVVVSPFEDEADLSIECDMIYGEEDEGDGDDGDDDFVDETFADEASDPPDVPLTVKDAGIAL